MRLKVTAKIILDTGKVVRASFRGDMETCDRKMDMLNMADSEIVTIVTSEFWNFQTALRVRTDAIVAVNFRIRPLIFGLF